MEVYSKCFHRMRKIFSEQNMFLQHKESCLRDSQIIRSSDLCERQCDDSYSYGRRSLEGRKRKETRPSWRRLQTDSEFYVNRWLTPAVNVALVS